MFRKNILLLSSGLKTKKSKQRTWRHIPEDDILPKFKNIKQSHISVTIIIIIIIIIILSYGEEELKRVNFSNIWYFL
jgi:hypothetical protein